MEAAYVCRSYEIYGKEYYVGKHSSITHRLRLMKVP